MSKETLGNRWEKNPEMIWDWVFKLISTYNYYAIDFNRLEKRFWEQNEFNIKLKLKLKATRAQFKDISDYFKKKSYRVEQLEIVIN